MGITWQPTRTSDDWIAMILVALGRRHLFIAWLILLSRILRKLEVWSSVFEGLSFCFVSPCLGAKLGFHQIWFVNILPRWQPYTSFSPDLRRAFWHKNFPLYLFHINTRKKLPVETLCRNLDSQIVSPLRFVSNPTYTFQVCLEIRRHVLLWSICIPMRLLEMGGVQATL
jgi:hypothetical protein